MRRAFTLIEMLFFIVITPFVALALSGVFATLIRDIPQTTRLLQQNTTILNMLQQVRRDMDRAVGLPEQFRGARADADTLLIELPDGVARYQFEQGQVRRVLSARRDDRPPADQRIWSASKAIVTWQAWKQDDAAYAIEIRTALQQRVRGKLRDKLANTRVFFLHGLGKDQAIR